MGKKEDVDEYEKWTNTDVGKNPDHAAVVSDEEDRLVLDFLNGFRKKKDAKTSKRKTLVIKK